MQAVVLVVVDGDYTPVVQEPEPAGGVAELPPPSEPEAMGLGPGKNEAQDPTQLSPPESDKTEVGSRKRRPVPRERRARYHVRPALGSRIVGSGL